MKETLIPEPKPNTPASLDASVAGPLFMLSAALLFTLLNVLIKLMGPEYTVWHIGFYRFAGGMVLIGVLFGRRQNPFRGTPIWLLLLRGCMGAVAFICLVMAIRMMPLSTTMVIFYSFPAFAAIFGRVLYGERFGWMAIACIATTMAGVAVLFNFSMVGSMQGKILALVGGAFAGLTVTLIRALREKNGPVVIYFYFCVMGTVVTLPKFVAAPVWPITPVAVVMVLGIVVVSLVAQISMNQGFFYCNGWEGGVLMASEVLFTACVGILFLGEPTTAQFWIGGALIMGSVVALNRVKSVVHLDSEPE